MIKKKVKNILINDVVKYILYISRRLYPNIYLDNNHFSFIINELPCSLHSSYVEKNGNINNIYGVMDFEIYYFNSSKHVEIFNNISPEKCETIEEQITYCTYWFIRDFYINISNDDARIILDKVILFLKENGKI